MPYPQRAIRTGDFLYIRNFSPDRWPMGTAPGFGVPGETMPDSKVLDSSTFAAFADMDASPTKTWLITQGLRNSEYRPFFDAAFALRPAEELYDLRKDPDQIRNVASLDEYADRKSKLATRLMDVLKSTNDPRVAEGTAVFDLPPYTDGVENAARGKAKKK
jgi:uncharacterized sulfatase